MQNDSSCEGSLTDSGGARLGTKSLQTKRTGEGGSRAVKGNLAKKNVGSLVAHQWNGQHRHTKVGV